MVIKDKDIYIPQEIIHSQNLLSQHDFQTLHDVSRKIP